MSFKSTDRQCLVLIEKLEDRLIFRTCFPNIYGICMSFSVTSGCFLYFGCFPFSTFLLCGPHCGFFDSFDQLFRCFLVHR